MPTNLPPEAQAAYTRHLDANTLEEKIKTLEEFLSLIPKHKGTEKLIALHRSRLVKLKRELEEKKKARKGTTSAFTVPKEGDAQVVLVGVKKKKKTSILKALTNAKVTVGRPTLEPLQGIAVCCDGVQLQIVEAPAIMEGMSRGIANGKQILSLIRNADLIALVIDLTQDVDYQYNVLVNELDAASIKLNIDPPPIEVERTGSGGLLIFGAEKYDVNVNQLRELLHESGYRNAIVRIFGPISVDDILIAIDTSIVYRKALVIANKGDVPGTISAFNRLKDLAIGKFDIIPVSALLNKGLEELPTIMFKKLGLIRIWTKSEKGELGQRPLVMKSGVTVRDVAKKIHSRFLEQFKFAVLQRRNERIQEKRVGLNYELRDGDILQIITR